MTSPNLIKSAVQSEKAHKQMGLGIYTFMVDKTANKKQIANLVEKQFSVKVKGVNIAKFAPKRKRIAKSRKTTLTGGGKKAIVYLVAGHKIAMFTQKTEKSKKQQKGTKEKETELTAVESKEG